MGNYEIQTKLDIERNLDWDEDVKNCHLAVAIMKDAASQGRNIFDDNKLYERIFDECNVTTHIYEDKIFFMSTTESEFVKVYYKED